MKKYQKYLDGIESLVTSYIEDLNSQYVGKMCELSSEYKNSQHNNFGVKIKPGIRYIIKSIYCNYKDDETRLLMAKLRRTDLAHNEYRKFEELTIVE